MVFHQANKFINRTALGFAVSQITEAIGDREGEKKKKLVINSSANQ